MSGFSQKTTALSLICLTSLIGQFAFSEEWVCRWSADKDGFALDNKAILDPQDDFPIGVCLDANTGFTSREKIAIMTSIDIWEDEYKNYKREKWGRDANYIKGIPPENLFVDCDIGNIKLWIYKSPLKYGTGGTIQPVIAEGWFSDYLTHFDIAINSHIFTDSRTEINSYYFMFADTVTHELGHALGIPHLQDDRLMFHDNRKCNNKERFCLPSKEAFDSFLEPYMDSISFKK